MEDFEIVRQPELDFPDSKHVRHVGLEDASDLAIFDHAKIHCYAMLHAQKGK